MDNQKKTVKIISLMDQRILISEIEEVAALDIGQPDCKLINPFVVKSGDVLEPLLLGVTLDDIFMMGSDKILTIAQPTPALLQKYEELTKE